MREVEFMIFKSNFTDESLSKVAECIKNNERDKDGTAKGVIRFGNLLVDVYVKPYSMTTKSDSVIKETRVCLDFWAYTIDEQMRLIKYKPFGDLEEDNCLLLYKDKAEKIFTLPVEDFEGCMCAFLHGYADMFNRLDLVDDIHEFQWADSGVEESLVNSVVFSTHKEPYKRSLLSAECGGTVFDVSAYTLEILPNFYNEDVTISLSSDSDTLTDAYSCVDENGNTKKWLWCVDSSAIKNVAKAGQLSLIEFELILEQYICWAFESLDMSSKLG